MFLASILLLFHPTGIPWVTGEAIMATTIRLTVLTGGHRNRKSCFCGPTRCQIGRAPDCFVQLSGTQNDKLISRHHCQLNIDPPWIRIVDLNSSNGTYVNGKKVEAIPKDLAILPNSENVNPVTRMAI
jgi:hypothetical protein